MDSPLRLLYVMQMYGILGHQDARP